jgi:anti-sigma B factor antagonist
MAESVFRVWLADSHAIVATPPSIDARNASELRRILLTLASQRALILVDLSETGFLGCEGVGALAGGLDEARAAGRKLLLVVGCPAQLRTLTIAGLTGMFSLYRTVTEALAAVTAAADSGQPGSGPLAAPA